MDLLDLRYLSVASVALNLTRAAETLGLNPSTVSRRITRLEDELGVTFFERGHHGIRLTEAGKSVMIHVHRALDDLEALARAGKHNGEGLLGGIRLGVRLPPVGEPLCGLLAAWHAKFPRVELNLHELNDHELHSAMVERRLDIAIVPEHSLWAAATSIPLYTEGLLAALPVDHALSSHKILSWSLLHEHTMLIQEWVGSHTALEFYAALMGRGIRFAPHSAGKQSVLALVAGGFGVTLVTASQASVAVPGVIFSPIVEPNAFLRMHLVWASDREEPAVGRLVAFLRDETRSRGLC